ncbi:hypothetical protein JCM10213_007752 [Rhodosporidiobolus nylandii]
MPPSNVDSALPQTYPNNAPGAAKGGEGATTAAGQEGMHDDEFAEEEDEDEDQQEGEEELYESSSSPSTETDTLTWINWFCSLPGHEYFCEVAEDFIEDDFNLTGLAGVVPFYKEAMEMILDVEPEEDDEAHRVPDVSLVESSAELLYGLIHQRYILTRQGLQQMYAKYDANHFGTCPRVYCSQAKLVPCGRSDLPGVDTVKLFCPSCLDMYVPPSSRFQGIDGAFFGTTFPHLLFQTFPPPSTLPAPQPAPADPAEREPTTPATSLSKVYVPRIYGFKVSERARSGPRMMWMRMRPRTEGELEWHSTPVAGGAHDPSGAGGSGEKGHLFDDDRLEDEEEGSESEEEEDGAGGAGGAGGAAAGGGAVEEVAQRVRDASLASPTSRASLPPAKDGRAIKPLPQPRTSLPSAPSPQSAASSPAPAAATQASAALAASIQRHLAAASGAAPDLPRPPQPAVTLETRERGRVARVA